MIAWFDPLAPELFAADRIPVFTFPENFIYGFPSVPGLGVKLAEHYGGSYLPDADSFVPAPVRPIWRQSVPVPQNTCQGLRATLPKPVLAYGIRLPVSIP